jgi:hypothetical protein
MEEPRLRLMKSALPYKEMVAFFLASQVAVEDL